MSWKQFSHYKPKTYALSLDGKKITQEAFVISFANSSEFGNGAVIAPMAQIDDGYLDVVIVKPFPRYKAPNLVWKLFHQTFHKSRYVEQFRCKEVEILESNIKAHIDGEPVVFQDGIHLQVVPSSLKVIIPRGA